MSNFSRASLMAAYLAVAATLAACSQSPGDPTPVTPPPVAQKATVTVTDMTTTGVVPADNSVKFRLGVTGDGVTQVTASVAETCDGTPVTVTVSTVPVTGGTATAVPVAGTHPNGATCAYTVSATATNPAGVSDPATASGSFKVVYKYTDEIYVYFGATGGLPERLNLATKTKTAVRNALNWPATTLGGPLNCSAATRPLADGTYPQACRDNVTNGQHFDLYVDVKTQELKQYTTTPTGVTWRTQTYDASVIPAGHPTWVTAAQLSNGDWLYVDQGNSSVIRRFAVDSNGVIVDTVVYNGSFAADRSCTLIMVISN